MNKKKIGCGCFASSIVVLVLILICIIRCAPNTDTKHSFDWERVPFKKDVAQSVLPQFEFSNIKQLVGKSLPEYKVDSISETRGYTIAALCSFIDKDTARIHKSMEDIVLNNQGWEIDSVNCIYKYKTHSSFNKAPIMTLGAKKSDWGACSFCIIVYEKDMSIYIRYDECIPISPNNERTLNKLSVNKFPSFAIENSWGECYSGGGYWSSDAEVKIRFDKPVELRDTTILLDNTTVFIDVRGDSAYIDNLLYIYENGINARITSHCDW